MTLEVRRRFLSKVENGLRYEKNRDVYLSSAAALLPLELILRAVFHIPFGLWLYSDFLFQPPANPYTAQKRQ
jgi:hypothetical protein